MKFNYASLNNEEYEMYSLVPKITEHYDENECMIGDKYCSTYDECIQEGQMYDDECHDEPQRFKNHLKYTFGLNELTLDNDTYINLKSKFLDLEKVSISASSGSGSSITKYYYNLNNERYFEGEYDSTTQELKIFELVYSSNTDRNLVTALFTTLYKEDFEKEEQRFKNHLKDIFDLDEVLINESYNSLKKDFSDLEKVSISVSFFSNNITYYLYKLKEEIYFHGEYNSIDQELKISDNDRNEVTTIKKQDVEKLQIESHDNSNTKIYLKFEGNIVLVLTVDDNQEPELGKYMDGTYKKYILKSAKLYNGNNVILYSNKSTGPYITEYPYLYDDFHHMQFVNIIFNDNNFNGKQLNFKPNTINVTDKLLNVSVNDVYGLDTINGMKLVDILSNRPIKIESGYYRKEKNGSYENKETPKFKISDTEYENIYIQQTGDLNLEKQNKEFVIYILSNGTKYYVKASKNDSNEIINRKVSSDDLAENISDATIFNVMLTSLIINPRFEIPEEGLIFKIKDKDNYLTIHSGGDLNIIALKSLGDPNRDNEWITFISDKLSYEADSKNEVKEEQTKEEQTNEVKEEQTNEDQTNEEQSNEEQSNEGQTNEGQTNEVSTTNEQSQENSVTNLETTEEVTKKAGGVSIILVLILIILAILYYILKVKK